MCTSFADLAEDGTTANIMGIIAETGDLRTSKQGNHMRNYQLMDETGVALSLIMHSTQADQMYVVGTRVAIYSVVIQSSVKDDEPGAGWVYDESAVIALGSSPVPALRGRVNIE